MAAQIKTQIKIREEPCLNSKLYSDSEFNSQMNNNLSLYFDGMEYITDYIIKKTDQQDLDICLNILKNLIFHTKKDVVAYSLGKLYPIFNDEHIKELMVKELRRLQCEDGCVIQKNIDKSMEIIVGEMNGIEIFQMECNIFNNITHKFELYLINALNKIPFHMDDKFVSRLQKSRIALQLDDMICSLDGIMEQLEYETEFRYNLEEADSNYHYHETIMEINKLESNENNFNNLIDLYALTFREKGHLNHLIALLNDENPEVRTMGVNGLLYVLKVLTHFHEQVPYEEAVLEILNSIKTAPKITRLFKSRINLKRNSK